MSSMHIMLIIYIAFFAIVIGAVLGIIIYFTKKNKREKEMFQRYINEQQNRKT